MDIPTVPKIQHHVDPLRYPRVQGQYESQAKKAFHAGELFEDIVKTMVEIIKEKK